MADLILLAVLSFVAFKMFREIGQMKDKPDAKNSQQDNKNKESVLNKWNYKKMLNLGNSSNENKDSGLADLADQNTNLFSPHLSFFDHLEDEDIKKMKKIHTNIDNFNIEKFIQDVAYASEDLFYAMIEKNKSFFILSCSSKLMNRLSNIVDNHLINKEFIEGSITKIDTPKIVSTSIASDSYNIDFEISSRQIVIKRNEEKEVIAGNKNKECISLDRISMKYLRSSKRWIIQDIQNLSLDEV